MGKGRQNHLSSIIRRIRSPWGLPWLNRLNARDEIKRLIDELSHRRVLYQPHAWEVASETIISVLEIRRELVATLKNVPKRTETHRLLTIMAEACLEYLDNREVAHDRRALEAALDKLRTAFGACLLVLTNGYHLDLDGKIADILPDSTDIDTLRAQLLQ